MTIYIGRVTRSYNDHSWIKPEAMAESGEYGWRTKANEVDFPSRGAVHAPKGIDDGLHEGTMWVFELQENPYFEQKPSGAKYSAVKLQPAYVLLDLKHLPNQEALRQALLRGASILPVDKPEYCYWLLRTADGVAIQLDPDQVKVNSFKDRQVSLMLSQSSLNDSLDVTGSRLPPLPKGSIHSLYYHPHWLPLEKEVFCWDSDARFMERIVNRIPKLKRRCEQAGLSFRESSEISKAKAREALEILELSGTLSDAKSLEQTQFSRLKGLLENIDANQYLTEKLFDLVYDNDAIKKHLKNKEKEYIQTRQCDIEQQITVKQDKLKQLQAKIEQVKAEYDEIQFRNEQAQEYFRNLNLQAEQDMIGCKQSLAEEFEQFKHELLEQSHSVQKQISVKLAETLVQNQLLQLVAPTTTSLASPQQLMRPAVVTASSTNLDPTPPAINGISDASKWHEELANWCEIFHLDINALYLADAICRSREIAMLLDDSGAWLAQCYASLFGHRQVLRYTPGPTTLSLEDLFFRGGTGAPTQFQAWLDRATNEPELVHLVMLEQVYCEQAHLWLPALARELRFGNRIPANVLIIICACDDVVKLEAAAHEAIWPIECDSTSVSRAGFVEDPKAIAFETPGLDVGLVCPGKQMQLRKAPEFSGLQQSLRNSHGQSPETWNRFNRILSTAVHLDEQRLLSTGQNLLQHLQATS